MANTSVPNYSSPLFNNKGDAADEAILEAKRAKRRVPPEKRKRAAQSCARCKDKRVRCVREEGALVCNACIKAEADCYVCASAGSKRHRYSLSRHPDGDPSASASTSTQQQQQQQLLQSLQPQQDIQNSSANARSVWAPVNDVNVGEDRQMQALDNEHYSLPLPQQHAPQSAQDFTRTATSHSHLVHGQELVVLQDKQTAAGLANAQHELRNPDLVQRTPLRSTELDSLNGIPHSAQYQDSVLQEKASDNQSGTAISGQPAASTTSQTFTPSQESHEHNDATGQTHYTGPSASLTLVADLRSVIRQYDADAAFVRDTHVHALGSDQTPSSLLTVGVGGWMPQANTLWPLIEAFFRLVHPSFPVLRQTSVWQFVEGVSATTDLPDNWQFVMAAIIALSLSAQGSTDFSMQGTASAVAQLILGRITCSTSFLGLQGLLLYSYYLHNHNQRDAAWNVLGAAVRMATALGMHRHSSNWSNLSMSERETRKLAFWTMYRFERFLCATLGRPSALQDVELLTDMPLDWAVETVSHMPVGYIEHATALDRIMGRASQRIYESQAEHTANDIEQILSELVRWKTDLPNYFDVDSPMPPQHKQSILALHARYYALREYATRPALVQYMQENNKPGSLSAGDLQDTIRLSRVCVDSAVDCTKVLRRVCHGDSAVGRTSLVLFFAYNSILIFAVPLACELVRRRRAAENSNTQLITDISPGHEIVVSCLRDCLSMLDPSKDLLPTICRWGQVGRDLCAAIQIEAQQATAQAALQPGTSVTVGSAAPAAAAASTSYPAAPEAATAGAISASHSLVSFAAESTHASHPNIPGHSQQYDGQFHNHQQQHEQNPPPSLPVDGVASSFSSAAAPFQTPLAGSSSYNNNINGYLQYGFDFGIDPSILDTGQPALPSAQQWDDLLQWLQTPGGT